MLFQVIANQFLVIKKTWPNMLILIAGAASNVILNYLLIPVMGIEGAALGTLAGYMISLLTASVVLIRMKLLEIRPKFCISACLMTITMVLWRLKMSDSPLPSLGMAVAGCLVIMVLYLDEIKRLTEKIKDMKSNIRRQ